jgi:hypothetical protein
VGLRSEPCRAWPGGLLPVRHLAAVADLAAGGVRTSGPEAQWGLAVKMYGDQAERVATRLVAIEQDAGVRQELVKDRVAHVFQEPLPDEELGKRLD